MKMTEYRKGQITMRIGLVMLVLCFLSWMVAIWIGGTVGNTLGTQGFILFFAGAITTVVGSYLKYAADGS